ncbi:MAG: hypothetical protein V3T17_11920 [Pseudomonadales bacterium]
MKNETGDKAGHPWYYKLGGAVHKPKQILSSVKKSGYQGYKRDDIKQADNKYEPERSVTLSALRKSALKDLRSDLERYRAFACKLRDYRLMGKSGQEVQPIYSDTHVSMSLKYNHLYNDFAHWVLIDDLLSQQADLFG